MFSMKKENYRSYYKLICDCGKKIIWSNLQHLNFLVRNAMTIEKLNTVISFKQIPWMAPYIDINT